MSLLLDPITHQYTLDGRPIPGISEILKSNGLMDTSFMTEDGRDRGHAVHMACHFLDEGDLDYSTVDPAITGWVSAYQKFLLENKVTWRLIETPIAHAGFWFAGTPDREGSLNGRDAIVEIKSGAKNPVTALQTAAQEILMPPAKGMRDRIGLHLRKDGTYRLEHYDDLQDGQIFLSALTIFSGRKNNGNK